MKKCRLPVSTVCVLAPLACAQAGPAELQPLIAQHAAANAVPESLVHRIIRRESNYNPGAVGRGGALGLMQIKYATARVMGYSGPANGLLDAGTNLAYAVRYLGNAYRVAGGNEDRALGYYAGGYYYAAKRKRMTAILAQHRGASTRIRAAAPTDAESRTTPANFVADALTVRAEGSGSR
jgi:soluble lytic murein transglycosylase-like protein